MSELFATTYCQFCKAIVNPSRFNNTIRGKLNIVVISCPRCKNILNYKDDVPIAYRKATAQELSKGTKCCG